MDRPFLRLIGNFFDIDDLAEEFQQTDYNWFVMKNVTILKSHSSGDEEKITALQHIGNLAYIGTKEKSVQIVICVLPLLLVWLKRLRDISPVLRRPLLQTLCSIVHRSRLAQEMIGDDLSVLPIVSRLIANCDDDDVPICRWLCYFLLLLISDSGKLLSVCSGNEELTLSLGKASAMSWEGWPDNVNVARKLLDLLKPEAKRRTDA